MKIISLNIWGGCKENELLDFFQSHKHVDIFCLQEVYYSAENRISTDENKVCLNILNKIADLLVEHEVYFCQVVSQSRYGIATLVKKSFVINKNAEHSIYENNNYGGRGPSHSRKLQHIALMKADGKKVNLINVHGLWNGRGKIDSSERIDQSKSIKNYIEKLDGDVVLCGDFNLRPDTKSMEILDFGMRNLIAENNIYSTRTSLYGKPEQFADYVLVSPNVVVKNFKVLTDIVSDHSPLYLELR